MNDDKWQELLGTIKDDFAVESEYSEPLDDGPGTREGIIFTNALGKIKLERVSRPVVLGTKGLGSKRIGSQTSVQYEYDESETSRTLTAHLWKNDVWVEIDAAALQS